MKNFYGIFVFFLTSCSTVPDGIYPVVTVNESFIKEIVKTLSVDIGPRNFDHFDSLMRTSEYIQRNFQSIGYKVELQKYTVAERVVENIIVSVGPKNAERIIVGAHYDTFGNQVGADDNASGIAGLLALAKLLKDNKQKLKKRVDLVAFTLEEPPFFRSEGMGSYIHAKSLNDKDVNIFGMISLEMIGYFSTKEDSQEYPLGILHLFYPNKGNFIGVVSDISSWSLKSELSDHMSNADIDVQTLAAPASLVGVDFSDHLNYWKFGYDAVMVTDTAFYRNTNYHQETDTIETLDFANMTEVIRGVYYGVLNMAIR